MVKASNAWSTPFQQGTGFLAKQGINLHAVLDCARLPESVTASLQSTPLPLSDYARLVLLGSAGKALWPALTGFGFYTDDPIDYFACKMTELFVRDYLDDTDYLLLYPGDYLIPLQQLGALAGWHQPSPLGIGIHDDYGLWFAYRVAFLTKLELPLSELPLNTGPSPCASCEDKPCISRCPAAAVKPAENLDIPACMSFRLQPDSDCQLQCLARLACPLASEHRYGDEQIGYHYGRSLRSIRRYHSS